MARVATQSQQYQEPIYHASRECSAIFDHCIGATPVPSDSNQSLLELRDQFTRWTTYVGAFAQPRASLDARVATHETIKDIILELLFVVHQNLLWEQDVLTNVAISGQQLALKDISHEDGKDTPAVRQYVGLPAIDATLKQLFRIATLLRQASRGSHQFGISDENSTSRSIRESLLKRQYPNMPVGLRQHLARSIFQRELSLDYLYTHNDKLSHDRDHDPYPKQTYDLKDDMKNPLRDRPALGNEGPPEVRSIPHPLETVPTQITPSMQGRILQPRRKPSGSIASSGFTVSEAARDRATYPAIPKQPFCPICAVPRKFTREVVWCAHVDEDLEPYVCLSEECKEPIKFFKEVKEWENHMQGHHTLRWSEKVHTEQWYCDLDGSEFNNPEALTYHLNTHHASLKLSKSRVMGKVRRSKRIATRDPFVCPFCDCVPQDITLRLFEQPYKSLWNHIGQHLKSLAFLSIPHDRFELETSDGTNLSFKPQPDGNTDNPEVPDRKNLVDELSFIDIPETFVVRDGLCEIHEVVHLDDGTTRSTVISFEDETTLLDISFSWDYVFIAVLAAKKLVTDTSLIGRVLGADSAAIFQEAEPTSTPQHDLRRSILERFCPPPPGMTHDGIGFMPKASLDRILSETSIRLTLSSEFGTSSSAEVERLARSICSETVIQHNGKMRLRTFRKIFALLVLNDKVTSVRLFLNENVSDLDLPLVPMRTPVITGFCRINQNERAPAISLKCFEDTWLPVQLQHFENYQWAFVAPSFAQGKNGVKHYRLHDCDVLPYMPLDEANTAAEKMGGFARVAMVQIHADYHDFQDQALAKRGFAIKQQIHEQDTSTFEKEICILKTFSGEQGHAHIVSLLATYEQFKKFNLIFYRAQADLFEYFGERRMRPKFTYANVLWIATQCSGLTHGLLKIHRRRHTTTRDYQYNTLDSRESKPATQKALMYSGSGTSSGSQESAISLGQSSDEKIFGRHGDINPSNILWYDDVEGEVDELRGTLKITDFNVSELNSQRSRSKPRDVAHSITYRPPEVDDLVSSDPPIIRQNYDIWGLGCVFLEFLTWFFGGEDLANKFTRNRLKPDISHNNMLTDEFFRATRSSKAGPLKHEVKLEVTEMIDELVGHSDCSQFCHDFLRLIQHSMLEVDSAKRSSSEQVFEALDKMHRRCRADKDYAVGDQSWAKGSKSEPQLAESQVEGTKIENSRTLKESAGKDLDLLVAKEKNLCSRCEQLDLSKDGFEFDITLSDIVAHSETCDFCALLQHAIKDKVDVSIGAIRLKRTGSQLLVESTDGPLYVLSMFRDSEDCLRLVADKYPLASEVPVGIPIGFPELPKVGGKAYFEVIKRWLRECDTQHAECYHGRPRSTFTMQLLDVQERRVVSAPPDCEYVALSYLWDAVGAEDLTTTTISSSFMNDVINCVLQLGIRYLWVDRYCIDQSDTERKHSTISRMGEIFRGAWCVLAACRDRSPDSGLFPNASRPQPRTATFKQGAKSVYICESIDNFDQDVMGSKLLTRAWTFQELLLARRMIFFTERQTYFLCGNGVQSELMTSPRSSSHADFFGDPNFPQASLRHGTFTEKVKLFQNVYRQYSRRQLTFEADVAHAIAGVGKVMHEALAVKGAYGILSNGSGETDGLFNWSLLWNPTNQKHEGHRRPEFPSWSWMSFAGPIDYMTLWSQRVKWEHEDIKFPWADSSDPGDPKELKAVVRMFTPEKQDDTKALLAYDHKASHVYHNLCVVVARAISQESQAAMECYVLLVAKSPRPDIGSTIYERVGVGKMPAACIDGGAGVPAIIV